MREWDGQDTWFQIGTQNEDGSYQAYAPWSTDPYGAVPLVGASRVVLPQNAFWIGGYTGRSKGDKLQSPFLYPVRDNAAFMAVLQATGGWPMFRHDAGRSETTLPVLPVLTNADPTVVYSGVSVESFLIGPDGTIYATDNGRYDSGYTSLMVITGSGAAECDIFASAPGGGNLYRVSHLDADGSLVLNTCPQGVSPTGATQSMRRYVPNVMAPGGLSLAWFRIPGINGISDSEDGTPLLDAIRISPSVFSLALTDGVPHPAYKFLQFSDGSGATVSETVVPITTHPEPQTAQPCQPAHQRYGRPDHYTTPLADDHQGDKFVRLVGPSGPALIPIWRQRDTSTPTGSDATDPFDLTLQLVAFDCGTQTQVAIVDGNQHPNLEFFVPVCAAAPDTLLVFYEHIEASLIPIHVECESSAFATFLSGIVYGCTSASSPSAVFAAGLALLNPGCTPAGHAYTPSARWSGYRLYQLTGTAGNDPTLGWTLLSDLQLGGSNAKTGTYQNASVASVTKTVAQDASFTGIVQSDYGADGATVVLGTIGFGIQGWTVVAPSSLGTLMTCGWEFSTDAYECNDGPDTPVNIGACGGPMLWVATGPPCIRQLDPCGRTDGCRTFAIGFNDGQAAAAQWCITSPSFCGEDDMLRKPGCWLVIGATVLGNGITVPETSYFGCSSTGYSTDYGPPLGSPPGTTHCFAQTNELFPDGTVSFGCQVIGSPGSWEIHAATTILTNIQYSYHDTDTTITPWVNTQAACDGQFAIFQPKLLGPGDTFTPSLAVLSVAGGSLSLVAITPVAELAEPEGPVGISMPVMGGGKGFLVVENGAGVKWMVVSPDGTYITTPAPAAAAAIYGGINQQTVLVGGSFYWALGGQILRSP